VEYIFKHKLSFLKKYARLLAIVFLLFVSVLCFEEVVDDVFYDPLEGDLQSKAFDKGVINYLSQFRSPALTQVMTDFTALGSFSIMTIILLTAAGVMWRNRKHLNLIYLCLVITSSGLLIHFLKLYFQRPRPEQLEQLTYISSLSFPSGHSFAATATYISLAYCTGLLTKTFVSELLIYLLAFILIALVGISRVYLGVHYPTDVIAGISCGAIWVLSVSFIFELVRISKLKHLEE